VFVLNVVVVELVLIKDVFVAKVVVGMDFVVVCVVVTVVVTVVVPVVDVEVGISDVVNVDVFDVEAGVVDDLVVVGVELVVVFNVAMEFGFDIAKM
jgi:hypothetical protein